MSTPLSNIRVFVQWTEQTIFAGEEVECEITFKNIATIPAPSRNSLHPSSAAGNGFAPGGERPRKATSVQVKNGAASPRPRLPPERGHKATLSLNVPPPSSRPQRTTDLWNGAPLSGVKKGKGGHGRSVSIISIGASESSTICEGGNGNSNERPRITKGHGRSSSLQIVPRRHGINGGPPSGKDPTLKTSQ
jgi:hypothetical protein